MKQVDKTGSGKICKQYVLRECYKVLQRKMSCLKCGTGKYKEFRSVSIGSVEQVSWTRWDLNLLLKTVDSEEEEGISYKENRLQKDRIMCKGIKSSRVNVQIEGPEVRSSCLFVVWFSLLIHPVCLTSPSF